MLEVFAKLPTQSLSDPKQFLIWIFSVIFFTINVKYSSWLNSRLLLLLPKVEHLTDLMENASIVPHVNQCEFHPYQNPKKLRNFCSENGIVFEVHHKTEDQIKSFSNFYIFYDFLSFTE